MRSTVVLSLPGLDEREMTTFPPHTLRLFLDTGKALLVLPMEPQPEDGVTAILQDDQGQWCDVWAGIVEIGQKWDAPHQPGDEIVYCRVVKPMSSPIEYIEDKATVMSVDAKKVAEMTWKEFQDAGLLSPTARPMRGVDGEPRMTMKDAWYAKHPDHPFDTSWAWLIPVERKDVGA